MKQQIKDFIYRKDNVSFAELAREIPKSAGERTMFTDNDSPIIWAGVSQEFEEAVGDLLREGAIVLKTTSFMTYAADRQTLRRYPIAKRIRKYAKPHWLPIVLCPAGPR
jgi:hypothetical protein